MPTPSTAYQQGNAAAARLKVGSVFQGAMPEADASGFEREQRTDFIKGYLDAIRRRWPNGVTVDEASRIVA